MILSEAPFTTFQGTGRLAGTWQYFVRMAGCAVKECPLRKTCDEQAALSFHGTPFDEEALADDALSRVGKGGWVHLTGGEPLEDPASVRRLVRVCGHRRLKVHLQTSGLRPLDEIEADWVTVSPKTRSPDMVLRWSDECVFVLDRSWIIDIGILAAFFQMFRARWFFLQPHYVRGNAENNMPEVLDWAGKLNRLGYPVAVTDQMHKHWRIK